MMTRESALAALDTISEADAAYLNIGCVPPRGKCRRPDHQELAFLVQCGHEFSATVEPAAAKTTSWTLGTQERHAA